MHLLLLSFLFLAAFAQRRGCCTPRAWEGEIMGHDVRRNVSFFETISYDHERLRMRVDVFSGRDRAFHHTTIFEETDRQGNNYVFVVHHSNGTCDTRTRPEPLREACVRENHHEEFRLTIGGHLHCTFYGFTNNGHQSNVVAAHSRHNGGNEDHCIPVEGVFLARHDNSVSVDARLAFFNVKIGIGNPIVFEVPKICKRLPAMKAIGHH